MSHFSENCIKQSLSVSIQWYTSVNSYSKISLATVFVLLLFFPCFKFAFSDDSQSVLEQAQKSLAQKSLANQTNSPQHINEGSASKVTKGANGLSTYENTDYQVGIMFPQSWKLSEVNLPQYGIAMFNAPEATDRPTSLESYVYTPAQLLVASQELPVKNMTLDKYIDFLFKDVYKNNTQYKVISSAASSLGGMDSRKITMYEYWDEGTYKVQRNVAIDPETLTVYMIKYSAHPGMFSRYLPAAQQMMNSFALR